MKVNVIVGTLAEEREVLKVLDEEKYYKVELSLDNETIPLVASNYVLKEKKGKCRITCAIRQENKEDSHKEIYLYALCIEELEDQNTPDVNEFYLGGRVVERFPTTFVGSACVESLVFRMSSYQSKQLYIFKLVALGKLARKFSDLKKGQVVDCKCYLTKHKGYTQFCIMEGTYRDSMLPKLDSAEKKRRKRKRRRRKKKEEVE